MKNLHDVDAVDPFDPMYEEGHKTSKSFGMRKRIDIASYKRKRTCTLGGGKYRGGDGKVRNGRTKVSPIRKNYRKKLGWDCPLQFTREVMKNEREFRWPRLFQRVYRRQCQCRVVPRALFRPQSEEVSTLMANLTVTKAKSVWDRYEFSLDLQSSEVDVLRKLAQRSNV